VAVLIMVMQTFAVHGVVHARPCDVYAALCEPRDMMRMTRAPALSDARMGGSFTLYDGSIHGVYVDLVGAPRRVRACSHSRRATTLAGVHTQ
jgi:hypothetical protein